MAAPTPTDIQLPTAWLAPPPGLSPSNHIAKIEPVPIATSAVLAFCVIVVVTLIFNKKKKGSYLNDRNQEVDQVDKSILHIGPRDGRHIAGLAPITEHAVTSSRSSTGSHRDRHAQLGPAPGARVEGEQYLGHNIAAPNPMAIPKIQVPSPSYQRTGSLNDGTTLADAEKSSLGYSDGISFDSKVLYAEHDPNRLSIGAQLDDQISFTASSFVPTPRIPGDPY